MCGIVGYIGSKNSVDVVVEGLTRLEYRGYDSAGICLKGKDGELIQYKKAGKIDNLKNILNEKSPQSHIGIGHTRWATHGGVTDFNAHPHGNEKVNLVHNGIIENAKELKDELQAEGRKFLSETDTEVFLVLVTKYLEETNDLLEAVRKSFVRITGNSAFVIMDKGDDKIVAVKRGAPLVCGKSSQTNEIFVSSDPYALVGFADKIFFPQDEVVCLLNPENTEPLTFQELDGSISNRFMKQDQEMDLEVSDKGQYEHFMLKEIHEQPDLINKFIQYYVHGDGQKYLERVKDLKPRLFHISACGTAWHAGLAIKNFIEKNNKIPCYIDLASEFRYRNPLLEKTDAGLFISQSGETADTLAAQQLCKENGLETLAIVNTEGSTLFRDCDYNLLIKAGTEIGVASTKAFTLQVLTGYLLSHTLTGENIASLQPEMELLAKRITDLLDNEDKIKEVAQEIYQKKGFIYTGRGKYFPIALEGALKLKEIAYVHAEGYAAGELKHGPIALIDDSMVNVALIGPELYEKTRSNIEEVRARKGVIVTIGPEGDSSLEELSEYYIGLNFEGLNELSPVYVNVVTQILSYYIARLKGTDIDKPRNLAKSVTVE